VLDFAAFGAQFVTDVLTAPRSLITNHRLPITDYRLTDSTSCPQLLDPPPMVNLT